MLAPDGSRHGRAIPGNQLLSRSCRAADHIASRRTEGPDLLVKVNPQAKPAGPTGWGLAAGALLKPQREALRRMMLAIATGRSRHHIKCCPLRLTHAKHPAGAPGGMWPGGHAFATRSRSSDGIRNRSRRSAEARQAGATCRPRSLPENGEGHPSATQTLSANGPAVGWPCSQASSASGSRRNPSRSAQHLRRPGEMG